jgi:predicted metal-dependent hydrolase
VPDDIALPPARALVEAQRLLDEDLPFHAHEVLEGTWKAAPDDERDLWQGLAQLAVGLTHVERGNPTGAVTLLRRGVARIERYSDHPPYDVNVGGLVEFAANLADTIDRHGLPANQIDLPRLTRQPRV